MSDSFEGTRLCVSGTMMLGDRNQVIRFIRQNGGIWTSSVTASTEVLVIHPNELLPPTRKVRAAQSFGIPIVSEQWLLKSVAAGHCVETDPYAVKPPTNLLTSVFQSPALSKPIELTTVIFFSGFVVHFKLGKQNADYFQNWSVDCCRYYACCWFDIGLHYAVPFAHILAQIPNTGLARSFITTIYTVVGKLVFGKLVFGIQIAFFHWFF